MGLEDLNCGCRDFGLGGSGPYVAWGSELQVFGFRGFLGGLGFKSIGVWGLRVLGFRVEGSPPPPLHVSPWAIPQVCGWNGVTEAV